MVRSHETNLLKSLTKNEDLLASLKGQNNLDLTDQQFLKNYIIFLENYPDLIFIFSLDGNLLTNNLDELANKLGITSLQHISYTDIIPHEQFDSLTTAFNNIKHCKTTREQLQFNMITNHNEKLYFTGTFLPIKSLKNEVIAITVIVVDITEKINLEMNLDKTNKDYKQIFDQIHSGTWIWDVENNKIDFVSKGLADILQIPLETLYEQPDFLENVILPEFRQQFEAKKYLLKEGKPVERTFQINTGNNDIKWIYEQTIPTKDSSGKIINYFGRLIDITKEMELKRKLEYLAKYDEVTDLPNNYSLQEQLDEYIMNKNIERFALFCINIDNFQWITDYLGYKIGDVVMKKIADRLVKIKPDNGFVAKENNDSFVYIITNYNDEEELVYFVENVMDYIAKKLYIKGYEFFITASIGITYYPKHSTNKLSLLEQAHSALHYAKKIGKNNYQVYSSNRDISSHKKYQLERDLRKAIKNKDFEIYFQPQVNAKTNEVVGAEALIRWKHKEWGMVSPEEFIQIAEKKHLIGEIGDWMIKEVCRQINHWRNQGKKLIPISINISPIQLLKPGLIDTIKNALKTYNVPAEYIVIEITEGSLLQKEKFILDTLNEIKNLGIKIALDDFGTGYSTFQYFQTFDLDILKIDRSFIQNLFTKSSKSSAELAIVSSFLHFAKSMGIEVTAEGVEEIEQLKYLAQKECDIIQGYLYSKPLPKKEFENILQKKYLTPVELNVSSKPDEERRKYFRFKFPSYVPVKIYVTKVGTNKVNVGFTTGLIDNIGIGGMRILSKIRLPVDSELNYKFEFEIMGEKFIPYGKLIYKNEEKQNIYSYGVIFQMEQIEREKLSNVINEMTNLAKLNKEIPNTEFIDEQPVLYLQKY